MNVIDVAGMPQTLTDAVPGVAGVDHVHVWSITSGRAAATMEIKLTPGADPRETLRAVKTALNDTYGIGHSTIEIDFGDKNRDCSLVTDPPGERKEQAR